MPSNYAYCEKINYYHHSRKERIPIIKMVFALDYVMLDFNFMNAGYKDNP